MRMRDAAYADAEDYASKMMLSVKMQSATSPLRHADYFRLR